MFFGGRPQCLIDAPSDLGWNDSLGHLPADGEGNSCRFDAHCLCGERIAMTETGLPGVHLFEPSVFGDERGFFLETFRRSALDEADIGADFVQHNHSRSQRGVLRGLHYQLVQPQGKLVRCARGRIFDVAVDIRRGSESFGQWFGAVLDDGAHRQLYVPPDFAHGFLVLSEVADVIYKCTDYYHPDSEAGIAWDDREIGIEWPLEEIGGEVGLSDKDREHPTLAEQDWLPDFRWGDRRHR